MINVIVLLLIVGAALYCIQLVPIDANIKTIINVLIVVATIIYLLREFAPAVIT